MEKPTVGRKVWLWGGSAISARAPDQPMDATIVFVHSSECVDVDYTNHWGTRGHLQSAPLQLPVESPGASHGVADRHGLGTPYVTWMPFQVKQAAKAAPSLGSIASGESPAS